ncbi:MAG: hypothetical protein U0797_30640 [Gemmataceae bacterium]
MSTVLAGPTFPVTTLNAAAIPAAPAPAEAPPPARAGDRLGLFFWLGCAGALTCLLLVDMARWLLRS